MNRLDDLRHTLAHNLQVLHPFAGAARLLVGCFDDDDACGDWVRAHFRAELESGLLYFFRFQALPYWHFCWAKNAFTDVLEASYYSSLDADNYLSTDEVSRILQLINESDAELLIHHFSGTWGDGTSGRLTLPTRLYRERPYIDELMPRQFDEIGVMLKVIATAPHVVYVSRPGVNVIENSSWCREFIKRNRLAVNHREEDLGEVVPPDNPRGWTYVQEDERIWHYHNLNAAYARWKLSCDAQARQVFEKRLDEAQRRYVRTPECLTDLHKLLGCASGSWPACSGAITLYAVNRNNYAYLGPWIAHYRELGVERFIVVDDGSDQPLEKHLPGDDVFVFRPRFGAFRVSKVFWLRALLGALQQPGTWALTVDVDEFLDVADREQTGARSRLAGLTASGDANGWHHFPALLLDMMPAPGVESVSDGDFTEVMNWHYERPVTHELGYQHARPVQWAFGRAWPVALTVDVRFRLFGTLDCLRKIPLFRFGPRVDLNQGFHALMHDGVPWSRAELLPRGRGMLPMRHYKMAKYFRSARTGDGPFERTEQYFERTQKNLARIAAADRRYVARCWRATPFTREYTGPAAFRFYDSLVEEAAGAKGRAASAVQ